MNALTNAVLVAISGTTTIDAAGDPTASAPTWTGSAEGYLKREFHHALSGGQDVEVKRDIFTILNSAGAPVVELAGADWHASTVTIIDQRTVPAVTRTFTVNAMENRAAGTIADSVRLELEQERA